MHVEFTVSIEPSASEIVTSLLFAIASCGIVGRSSFEIKVTVAIAEGAVEEFAKLLLVVEVVDVSDERIGFCEIDITISIIVGSEQMPAHLIGSVDFSHEHVSPSKTVSYLL